MDAPAAVSLSVADFARRLRRAVASVGDAVWIEGEIASLKRAASGHVYFTLKDPREEAALDCVMYRMDALRARAVLRDGVCIQAQGRATLWVPRGRLQVAVSAVRLAGAGALLEQLERLKRKLHAEGLFAAARKRPLPAAPRCVGLVTSAHGAALHDLVAVSFRRGRVLLVLAAAQVQGEGAPQSLVVELQRLQRDPRVEVIIIGRGGGSSEDLMAFNDERVVRCVAASRVPIVSAVGHEVDTTLTDLAADVRAATPSQAAELVVPDDAGRARAASELAGRLRRAMRHRLAEERSTLGGLSGRIGDPRFLIALRQQDLDEAAVRAERALARRCRQGQAEVTALRDRLAAQHPRLRVARCSAALGPLTARLRAALALRLQHARGRLEARRGPLLALSPLEVLQRGYAIATDPEGRVVTAADPAQIGQRVTVRVHRGHLLTEVVRVDQGPRSP